MPCRAQMVGSYYCYDNPSALNKQMEVYFTAEVDKAHIMTHKQYQTNFNLLYTVYSIPNIVLPFFGGYFTDLWGARTVNIICSSFILCGQLLVALGAHMQLFSIMIAGRVVFGFGGESLCVSQVSPHPSDPTSPLPTRDSRAAPAPRPRCYVRLDSCVPRSCLRACRAIAAPC